jgi:hypothetical protein
MVNASMIALVKLSELNPSKMSRPLLWAHDQGKGVTRVQAKRKPRSHITYSWSVGKCEGVNLRTRKATPTLGDGVPMDSRNLRERFQRSKLNGLWRSLYH